jgi:probable addiction module antidote protein
VAVIKIANKMTLGRQKLIGRSIKSVRNYPTVSEFTEEYLRDHPEEIDGFVSVLFEEYAKDGDAATLLSALRIVSRVKGLSALAENADLSRGGVQTLSEDGDPKLGSVNAILHALGYWLAPQKLQAS